MTLPNTDPPPRSADMGRAKQTTKTATKRRTRKTKATEDTAGTADEQVIAEAVPEVVVTPDEQTLAQKYGHTHRIVPGSLRYAGGREGWGQKRTVEVQCPTCADGRRVVATSDLQWSNTRYCLACVTDVKKNQRDKKKQEK